ncbi:hypothetical protein LNTAR_13027 [Lentisphaera araneosa HTCC2155]|jgi:hypothetical protein|uniref:Uncharacterized protein n=1 Tax=Lentisphaera araneosa HTCC2155 TaxID=313628 RepID=A6DRK4_9BACT|nr:hypothetical protein [Lentisphaera araneosa]EDM25673.1 hypothetical protein LNTAR_13027 [Lentisphaera araneosa HTCC2155]
MENTFGKAYVNILKVFTLIMLALIGYILLKEFYKVFIKYTPLICGIIHIILCITSLIRIKHLKLSDSAQALWTLIILTIPIIGPIVSSYMTSNIEKNRK